MEKLITRRNTLGECLRIFENRLQAVSKHGYGLEPKRGAEAAFDEAKEHCRVVRELMQALENERVREAVARWRNDNDPQERAWQKVIEEEDAAGIRGPLTFTEGGAEHDG